eukprot:3940618-Rhodomonas_salina.1
MQPESPLKSVEGNGKTPEIRSKERGYAATHALCPIRLWSRSTHCLVLSGALFVPRCLYQALASQYSFVLHTTNPMSGSQTEMVGELLVLLYPCAGTTLLISASTGLRTRACASTIYLRACYAACRTELPYGAMRLLRGLWY